jgi:hypothetical protein
MSKGFDSGIGHAAEGVMHHITGALSEILKNQGGGGSGGGGSGGGGGGDSGGGGGMGSLFDPGKLAETIGKEDIYA